jgi:hypothetical protein
MRSQLHGFTNMKYADESNLKKKASLELGNTEGNRASTNTYTTSRNKTKLTAAMAVQSGHTRKH